MKNLSIVIIAGLLFVFSSCAKDHLAKFNDDKKHATVADPGSFFASAEKALSDNLFSTTYTASGPGAARLFVQYMTSVTYLEGTIYIPEFSWSPLYIDVLSQLNESKRLLSLETPDLANEQAINKNKINMAEILSVYAYLILVDSYGNIPYSGSLDFDNVLPEFDDAAGVYINLAERLESAVAGLDESQGGFGGFDIIYNGNTEKWIRFGNSLKLQIGMRMIDANKSKGEEIVRSALAGKLIESNADNALFRYESEYPNTNPYYSFLVRQNLKYFVASTQFIGTLNNLNDPRRPVYFTTDPNGQFTGVNPGEVRNYPDFSKLGDHFRRPDLPNIFFDAARVEFFLAEAAEREIISKSEAETHYNNAIRASFDYYEVDGVDDYLAQPEVNYQTASGSWQKKIGIQKWIALFEQGFEGWTEFRRLKYPELEGAKDAFSNNVPRRFLYPITEQSLNGQNYQEAASAMGGDTYESKIFWDK